MRLEELLASWTGPSSSTEQDKQDRTERMIKEAVVAHPPFANCSLSVYAKGSYANNTNVKSDSDVDIAVQCHECRYWHEAAVGARGPAGEYNGSWTPAKLRAELETALRAKFGSQVDSSGSTAFRVRSSSARVEADIVPGFDYRYYFEGGSFRDGVRIFKKDGGSLINYPEQQLVNGKEKNRRTNLRYKKVVRVLKRIENAMASNAFHVDVPSFLVECLVYNCADRTVAHSTWLDSVRETLAFIQRELQGDEPTLEAERWLEVNECKFLFASTQDWQREDGRAFAEAGLRYLGSKA